MTNALMKVGVVTSAHGVRGQVKIHSFIDNPESLFSRSPLTDATGKRIFKLTRQGIKDSLLIVSIEGVPDRNAAELLKGMEIFAPASDRPPLKVQLTGLEARLVDGNVYGRVIGVYNFGAGDVLEIERGDGSAEMLPFNENFFGDVQIDEGSLVVYPPDYLEAK